MTWPDFYQHYDEWAESTQLKKISSLENIGPASEVADACNYLCGERAADALVRKAIRLGLVFTPQDIIALDGTISEPVMELAVRKSLEVGQAYSFAEISQLDGVIDTPLLSKIVQQSLEQGHPFTPQQVIELSGIVEEDVLTQAAENCGGPFSRDQLDQLDGMIDSSVLEKIRLKQGLNNKEDGSEEKIEEEESGDSFCSDASDETDRWDENRIKPNRKPARNQQKKRHTGLFTGLAIRAGIHDGVHGGSRRRNQFQIGDHVRVKYRGQEGTVIDINGSLYVVSMADGRVDSYSASDLERAW